MTNTQTQIDFDVSWYTDTKRSKDLRKSTDLVKWRIHAEALQKTILDLNVVVKEFEKGTKWLEERRLGELGKLYHEYRDLRARVTDLHQVGNEMLKAKAVDEQRRMQSIVYVLLDDALKKWTTTNTGLSWLGPVYTHLKQKSSCVTYCKQQDKFNQLIVELKKTTSQIEEQIENGDRSAKIRTSVHRFINTVEEVKAVCCYQKSFLSESGANQRQNLFEGDEVNWMAATQKWLHYLEAIEKESAFSDNFQDPVETTETSLLMTNNETSETEDGKQVENQNNVEGNVASANTQEEVKAPQKPSKEKPNITGTSVVSPQKNLSREDDPEDVLGALKVSRGSTASSRSSRRRLQLEAEIAEDESRAKIVRKEQELELRRKKRETKLEAQKEEMEFTEMRREEKLSLKLKKMEMKKHLQEVAFLASVSRFAVRTSKLAHGSIPQRINLALTWRPSFGKNFRLLKKARDRAHRDELMLNWSNQ